MFESKYSKILTIILIVVIISIIGLLGFLAYDFIYKSNTSKQASDFVETYESGITSVGDNGNTVTENTVENIVLENVEPTGITTTTTTTSSSATSPKKKYQGFTVAGTMKIPAIKFEYPIIEEVTSKALDTAVIVLYPGGDNLNKPGNTVIIGHNYRNGLFFSNLKKLTNGAKIYVTDFRGVSLTYEVYNIFEASSTDTSFYSRDTNGLAELTLSTCTDANNDQRTIVFAKQVQ